MRYKCFAIVIVIVVIVIIIIIIIIIISIVVGTVVCEYDECVFNLHNLVFDCFASLVRTS